MRGCTSITTAGGNNRRLIGSCYGGSAHRAACRFVLCSGCCIRWQSVSVTVTVAVCVYTTVNTSFEWHAHGHTYGHPMARPRPRPSLGCVLQAAASMSVLALVIVDIEVSCVASLDPALVLAVCVAGGGQYECARPGHWGQLCRLLHWPPPPSLWQLEAAARARHRCRLHGLVLLFDDHLPHADWRL